MKDETKQQALDICRILYDKKADDIIAINVSDKTIIADWFIICSGKVSAQVKALCDEVEEKTPALGLNIRRKEGYAQGRWIVLDFGNILLHIFHPEERKYFNLERLWVGSQDSYIDYSRLEDAKLEQE